MNLANQVTLGRLALSIIYFVILGFAQERSFLFNLSIVLFIIAALTDILDGYLARQYRMITSLGRILDPGVDKILICGTFILLVSWYRLNSIMPDLPWIVVVIVGREFLVQTIRGMGESEGMGFPSIIWGKLKMWVQSITIIWILFHLAHLTNVLWSLVVLKALVWLTLISTILSALVYLYKLKNFVSSRKDL